MAIKKYYVYLSKDGKWHARQIMNWGNGHVYRGIIVAESRREAIQKGKKEYNWKNKGVSE